MLQLRFYIADLKTVTQPSNFQYTFKLTVPLLAPNSSTDSNRPCSHWEIGGSALINFSKRIPEGSLKCLQKSQHMDRCLHLQVHLFVKVEETFQCKFIQVDSSKVNHSIVFDVVGAVGSRNCK
jgi:hypothetical protein